MAPTRKVKQPRTGFDSKDLAIVDALGQLGGKVSAEELAEITGYAARTIRHRLKRLRDNGYLAQLYAQTHEYRLGQGDVILVLQESSMRPCSLKDILSSIPWFYYHGPTYGKYNGYITHALYSLDEPDSIPRIANELLSLGIIDDYFFFETIDYESRRGNFKFFEYNKGWNWDWTQWIAETEQRISTSRNHSIALDFNPQVMSFDTTDLKLLRELKIESHRTLKELGDTVGLSETQVKRRITRLEQEGIIKGYRWNLCKIELPLYLYVFMEIPENTEAILMSFYHLPFPCEIAMESRTKYCVRIRLYGTELPGLLRGLTRIRGYTRSFFVQLAHDIPDVPADLSDLYYNESSGKWEYPVDDVLSQIRKRCKQ